jgi:hypothetical protein
VQADSCENFAFHPNPAPREILTLDEGNERKSASWKMISLEIQQYLALGNQCAAFVNPCFAAVQRTVRVHRK